MYQKAKRHKAIIMLLMALLALTPAALTSCGDGSNDYAEAEEIVAGELDKLKAGSGEVPGMAEFTEDSGLSEAMYSVYAEKLRDFDYVIAGSSKTEDGKSVIVTVDITTYDFGSVYLETWKDSMKVEADYRIESQFYNDLFTRFASMSVKNCTGQASITCTKDEEGKWTTDLKTNPELIDAISGGMLSEMKELAEEQ